MIGDSYGDAVVFTGNPLRHPLLHREQPCGWTRPGVMQKLSLLFRYWRYEGFNLRKTGRHEYDPFVHGALFEGQQPQYRVAIQGVATQAIHRFSWVGDYATLLDIASRQPEIKVAQGRR